MSFISPLTNRSPNTGINGGQPPASYTPQPAPDQTPAPTPSPAPQGQAKAWTFSGQPAGDYWNYGWDFGAHQGQSFDWNNPAHGAKYAFANYINQNGLNPDTANAASVAAGLNQLYGGNVFQAQGDKRVGYGDEFVDWSGQGKPHGQFFWGSHGPAMGGVPGAGGYQAGAGNGLEALQALFGMFQQPQAQQASQPNWAALAQALSAARPMTGPAVSGANAGTASQQQTYQRTVEDALRRAFGG